MSGPWALHSSLICIALFVELPLIFFLSFFLSFVFISLIRTSFVFASLSSFSPTLFPPACTFTLKYIIFTILFCPVCRGRQANVERMHSHSFDPLIEIFCIKCTSFNYCYYHFLYNKHWNIERVFFFAPKLKYTKKEKETKYFHTPCGWIWNDKMFDGVAVIVSALLCACMWFVFFCE